MIAAETIRKHSATDRITLIGDEREPVYSRMAIPYLLMGNIDESGTYLRKNPAHFDELKISMIRDWVESKGIEVFTSTKVESIEPGKPLTVKLSNGKSMLADLVISAAGVRPAIRFMQDSGVLCLLGVLTDEHLQTNVPGIFAAGDCAEAFDKVSGTTMVSAIQPNASEQARIAAVNMVAFAKGRTAYAHLKGVTQINVLDTLGLISASFGDWSGVNGGEHVELTDRAAGRHLSLQFRDDVLVGCNSVGWTEHVGIMRGLVEGQIKLGPWKEILKKDPTRLADAYLASAQGHADWSGATHARRR